MAERTVNVNINYNIKTADLDRLANVSARAEAATKKFQQSSEQASKQTSSGYKFAARSIEGMELELQRLRQQIKLTGIADTARLNRLKADYKSATQQLDAFKKQYLEIDKASKQVAQSTRSTTQEFGQLFTAVKLLLTAGLVRETVDMALSMSRLAGNVEGVDRAFRRAFPNADSLLTQLRRSTHGTVNDFILMQRTLQATNLGVSVEHLGTLFEFAATRAQQTGESVDYLVDSIVRGIGRKSSLVLDNLGLSAIRLKEQFNGVALESLSVAEVTEGTTAIARVELDKMGGYAETAATKVDQLNVSWEKLRQTIAKTFEEGNTVEFLNDYVVAFQALIEAQERGITVSELLRERERNRVAQFETELFLQRNLTGEREKDVEFLNDAITRVQKDLVVRTQLIAKQKGVLKGLQDELKERRKSGNVYDQEGFEIEKNIDFRAEVIKQLQEEFFHREEWLRIYLAQLAALEKGNKEQERELGLIEKLEMRIEKLQERIKQATVRGTIFDDKGNLIEATSGSIAALNRELEILEGRLSDLKKTGLPEFKSPETFARISKIIEEDFKKGAEETTKEFIKIEESISRIDASLRNLPKDPIPIPETPFQPDFLFQLGESIIENQEELIQQSIDITTGYLNEIAFAEVEAYNVRIDNLRSFFDEQILLAGDNERAKQELRVKEQRQIDALRRQQAQKEKQARRFSVIVDTAASISKTAAQLGFPAALPFIALAIAQGALQLSAINRAQPRGFRKGEIAINGPGTTTSDSIPARISRGESVINAEATRNSMQLLEAVNAKKIDDRILKDIRQTSQPGVKIVQMDHRPIVEAIEKQKYPDLVRDGNIIWEAKRIGNIHKRYVRSKAMSK